MIAIFNAAGIFIYPLIICSILAVFVVLERSLALRREKVMPQPLITAFMAGDLTPKVSFKDTTGGRILNFFREQSPDPDALKAFAGYEAAQLERGLFILEIVVGAAPLIGLLGTVTGLVQVFSNISPATGLPEAEAFVQGTALALSTTMLGLGIAIPAMAAHSYWMRRVDLHKAQIQVGVERLISLQS